MFGTGHPKPPHRKEVAMQIVQQQRKTFAATELTVDPPDDGRVATPLDGPPLRFEVAYTLDDYLGMLREHRWDEVTGVRSYRRGYLLLFARGALPIPFRCLDSDQLQRLRALALARRASGIGSSGLTPPA